MNAQSTLVAYGDRREATAVYGGTVVNGENTNLNDALLDAGMFGWNVRKEELRTPDGFKIPKHVGVVGDIDGKKVSFGVAGDGYAVVEYPDAFAFGQSVLDSSDLEISSIGFYQGGGRGYVEFKVPKEVEIAGQDKITAYLRVISSHNGTAPIVAQLGMTRLFCTNQITSLLSGKTLPSYRVRHTGLDPLSRGNLADARNSLGIVFAGIDEYTAQAEKWAQTDVTSAQFGEIVERLFPIDLEKDSLRVQNRMANGREAVEETVKYSNAQAGLGLSAYSVQQGISEWQQWSGNKDLDQRAERSLNGGLERGQNKAIGIISDVLQLV